MSKMADIVHEIWNDERNIEDREYWRRRAIAAEAAEATARQDGAEAMREACIKVIRDPVGDETGGYWLSYANRQLVEGLMRDIPVSVPA